MFFDIFGDGYETPSGLLNSVPSALSRWTVESRLLDGSSVHDCVNSLKPDIIRHLEKLQLVEIQEKIAEEKRKKEESKKAAEKNKTNDSTVTTSNETSTITSSAVLSSSSSVTTASSTSTSVTTTTSSNTSIQSLATTIATSNASTPVTSNLESMTRSRRLVTSRLTTQDFSDSNRTVGDAAGEGGEQMEVSPSGAPQEVYPLPPPASAVPPQIPSYETPFNPIPDFVPNAPARELSVTTVAATPINRTTIDSSQPISTILAVSPSMASAMETPHNLPRMNQMRTSNQNALTGGLGLTPQVPLSSVAANTPRTELPSVAEILATPGDIPSLQQLRRGSLFSQPLQQQQQQATPSIPPSVRSNVSQELAPSPLGSDSNVSSSSNISDLTIMTTMATTTSSAGNSDGTTSVIAADLAAAIMSQLVTSSPTPSVSTTANGIDRKGIVTFIQKAILKF